VTAYHFDAARSDGTRVRGWLDAASVAEAAGTLVRRGLHPIAVEARTRGADGRAARWPLRTQATALRSLASLVSAGVPLAAALHSVRRVLGDRHAEAMERVEQRIREGSSLAAALESESLFAPVTMGLMRAGEAGAGLGPALEQAAHEIERRAEAAARVRSALAYPALLLGVGGISVLAILLFVVPRFAALLSDVAGTLPATTRLLLAASTLLRHHAPAGALVLALSSVACGAWIGSQRERWHEMLLGAPLVGPFRHALASARGARALAALLDRGSPALNALHVAGSAVGDRAVARRIAAAGERVTEGTSLSRALELERAFTPLTVQLATIGDGVGRLPDLLRRAADIEEQRAEQQLRGFVAMLEPALVLAFAAVVATVAAALLQAVYAIRPESL
jgi:general secretion pathway protein F